MYISDCSLDSPSSIKESSLLVRAFLLAYPERWVCAFKTRISKQLGAPISAPSELWYTHGHHIPVRWSWAVAAVKCKGDLSTCLLNMFLNEHFKPNAATKRTTQSSHCWGCSRPVPDVLTSLWVCGKQEWHWLHQQKEGWRWESIFPQPSPLSTSVSKAAPGALPASLEVPGRSWQSCSRLSSIRCWTHQSCLYFNYWKINQLPTL